MEKQFVTYEIALKLKELGFDEECLCTYSNGELSRNPSNRIDAKPIQKNPYTWKNSKVHNSIVCAPLWQQVIDWFIDKYDIHISLEPVYKPQQFQNLMYCYAISTKENFYGGMDDNLDNWIGLNDGGNMFHIENSRYKAHEQAILKAIELCKSN